MSKKPTPINRNKKENHHIGILPKLFLLFLLLIAITHSLPIVIVLFIGLLPTLTLLLIDPKNLNKLIVVGCFNLAGVFVYVFSVIRNYSIHNALFVFSDIFNMILMLCAAGLGLVIYYEMPHLFIHLTRTSNQRHIASIDAHISKLKEIWEPDVVGKQD